MKNRSLTNQSVDAKAFPEIDTERVSALDVSLAFYLARGGHYSNAII